MAVALGVTFTLQHAAVPRQGQRKVPAVPVLTGILAKEKNKPITRIAAAQALGGLGKKAVQAMEADGDGTEGQRTMDSSPYIYIYSSLPPFWDKLEESSSKILSSMAVPGCAGLHRFSSNFAGLLLVICSGFWLSCWNHFGSFFMFFS